MEQRMRLSIILATFFICLTANAQQNTTIRWFGHAAFEITTPKGAKLLIDPWLNNPTNPDANAGADPLKHISKVDYILLTHGHFDHVGDTVALAKMSKARLVTNFELGTNMVRLLDFPKDQIGFDTLMNIGGEITIADGEVKVFMTPAIHSSSLAPRNEKAALESAGSPGGFVLTIAGGPTIYHSGDTAFFRDMDQIGEDFAPDLALINIGGHFGMEPSHAAKAAKAVKAKLVIPMHYKTFPILTQDPNQFFQILDKSRIRHHEMHPGESLLFKGRSFVKTSTPNTN